jgi:hypothetical protein
MRENRNHSVLAMCDGLSTPNLHNGMICYRVTETIGNCVYYFVDLLNLPIFYHVDRDCEMLTPGYVMNLREFNYDRPEFTATLHEWYPDGIGRLGHLFITDKLPPWTLERERVLENVRRSAYAQHCSRLATVFACGSTEDAARIRHDGFGDGCDWSNARIWKVESCYSLRRDMNTFARWTNLEKAAHAYWSDEIEPDPFYEYLLKPPVKILEEVIHIPDLSASHR